MARNLRSVVAQVSRRRKISSSKVTASDVKRGDGEFRARLLFDGGLVVCFVAVVLNLRRKMDADLSERKEEKKLLAEEAEEWKMKLDVIKDNLQKVLNVVLHDLIDMRNKKEFEKKEQEKK